MGVTPIRALLFLAGGVIAGLVTAYFAGAFDPYIATAPKVAAVPPDVATPENSAAKGDRPKGHASGQPGDTPAQAPAGSDAPTAADPAATAPTDETAPAAGQTPQQAGTPELIAPSFDIVRVEPDGSLVVAGRAAPSAKVEVLTGSTVVGQTQAEPGGDFVSVLDKPLEPGEHQVVLRSTTPDNVVAMSTETALISIPEEPDGQVLALVEEPGKPSELITVPEPGTPAASSGSDAAAPSAPAAPDAGAAGEAEQAPAVAAAPSAGETPAQPGEQQAAAPQAGSEAQAPSDTAAPAAPGAGTTDMAAREPAGDQPAADAAAPAQPPAQQAGEPEAVAQVRVEAVEIEGRQVFVAGSAEPGSVVRVYANDALLGETRASPNGRFLVETERELPVGDYIIRADLVGEDGSQVLARAAVPFEREPGEMIAAVAPPVEPVPAARQAGESASAAAQDSAAAPAAPQVGEAAPAASDDRPESATAAAGTAAPVPGGGSDASAAASGQSDSATTGEQAVPDAAGGEAAPAGSGTAGEEPASAVGTQTAQTEDGAATNEQPAPAPAGEQSASDAASGQAAAGVASGEAASAGSAAPGEPSVSGTAQSSNGSGQVAAAQGTVLPDLGTGIASNAPEVTGAKLEPVKGAVIIRRGDSLWRISRRVYGRGIRYSTIYLANQDQIRDPDRIWPGQVFTVPKQTDAGETADMSAIGDQATTR